jgi:hypothetical protein
MINQINNLNLVFNFTYNENILESIFLKYLPYHKFYILYSKEFYLKFEHEEKIIQFVISRTSIYFYKYVSIHLTYNDHTFFAKKMNLFRNLMNFDNTISHILQVLKNIKIQKHLFIKNNINIKFTNFLNHNTNIFIYKNYLNDTFIKIQSEEYTFPVFKINNFVNNIITYFTYENQCLDMFLNNTKVVSLTYKEKNTSSISMKYSNHIDNVFTNTIYNLDLLNSNFVNNSAKTIQKQLVESMYNNKYKLCRKICYNTYFNELKLN